MTSILNSTGLIFRAALRPRIFFQESRSRDLITPVVLGMGTILVLGMLILIGTAMIYFQELLQARAGIVDYYSRTGQIPLVSNPSPWKYLSFPIVWAVIFVLTAAVRLGVMKTFAVEESNFLTLFANTVFGFTPFVCLAILHGIFNNLFPFAQPIEKSSEIYVRSYLLIGIFASCLIWEGIIFVRAATLQLSQNKGRAILTWLSPWFVLIVLYALLRFFSG